MASMLPAAFHALNPDGREITDQQGYDVVILSDLLHFNASHAVLISSTQVLLAHNPDARVHVAAGKYTKPEVCDNFLALSARAGFAFEEVLPTEEESQWKGKLVVSSLDGEALALRKANCRYWIGRRIETR
ncbi:unnamed protein product [Mycena citricolor]|uniref:Uncharacterized protein n=1 Tax=Mycena citricolor TaxID=2018698 RepID=A0AAD2K263_9AGAR|nr:unnamed protein product [Mycena citricolor]